MSDNETVEKPFAIERAKSGRAKCKKCKEPIDKDTVRIAKLMSNPFGEGKMKSWHHISCLFDVFAKQRATTKRIDNPDEDIDGWDQLCDDDKNLLLDKIQEFEDNMPFKNLKRQSNSTEAGPSTKKQKNSEKKNDSKKKFDKPSTTKTEGPGTKKISKDNDKLDTSKENIAGQNNPDDSFRLFRKLCMNIADVSAYTEKTACVKKMFTSGSNGDGFTGDIVLWCKLLLPTAVKRVYNVQSKQLIKLFARILHQSEEEMLEDLEQGDIAGTIGTFMEKSSSIQYSKKSHLTLQEIDNFLEKLSQLTREDEQSIHFKSIMKRCTPNDLRMIIKLIKNDLRIKCGPKHILEAIHEDAYRSYQHTNNLEEVVKKFAGKSSVCVSSTSALTSASVKGKVALLLMTPVLPMLAEACKSVEMAIKKCPNGMLSEIKYDGERVQVHKHGNEFSYFSRSLKKVMDHKVKHFEKFIPEAFPGGDDLILDSEILMIDRSTGQLLPFGTLGGKKNGHNPNVNVCIFIFDCIYYNGEQLLTTPMKKRREILEKRIKIIPNRVMLSEVQEVHDPDDLSQMIAKVLRLGLEGLVLKATDSIYEPGKRHWLKVKKDYLFDGAMADSADLVVLGAWYGTGSKGGMKSIFLMGCYDEDRDVWLTVTKVHSGHDDATLAKLQDQLDMIKISKDPGLLPNWIKANKPMIPDFIAKDPKAQPVWEITGAEFTNQGHHTADGISIRFPRVTKIRDDKDWSTATSLKELRKLFKTSSDSIDCSRLLGQPDNKKKTKKISTLDNFLKGKNNNKDEPMDIDDHQGEDKEKEICHVEKAEIMTDNNELPAFYAFIDKDYIEYDAAGNPLNWIEDRKPMTGLPENAKPLSEKSDAELRSKGILGKVCVILDSNIPKSQRNVLQRTLTTLGAEVRKDNPRSGVTHIIHGVKEINMTELRKYELPLARHVNESWVEAVVATSRMQDEGRHAVKLINSEYCDCSCAH